MDIVFLFLLFVFLVGFIFHLNARSILKKDNNEFEEIPVYREIPCNKDLFFAYWVGINYKLLDKKEDFLGAVLLSWVNNNNVKIEKNDEKSKNESLITISFINRPKQKMECKLYDYMYSASKNGKLEINEFTNWCKNNASIILGWFSDVIYFESMNLIKKKKLILKKDVKMYFFNCKYFDKDKTLDEEAKKLAGLKKFLTDFTLINEKEVIEVKLWKEYLIYAQLFGVADKVASKFEKMYPEIIEYMNNSGYNFVDYSFINSVANKSIKTAKIFKNFNDYRNFRKTKSYNTRSSYDKALSYGGFKSGGRGFSSRRGGRSSFGGGSRGGGGFR